jgi:hypothetical protein
MSIFAVTRTWVVPGVVQNAESLPGNFELSEIPTESLSKSVFDRREKANRMPAWYVTQKANFLDELG